MKQIHWLDFLKAEFPNPTARKTLAERLGVTPKTIENWFFAGKEPRDHAVVRRMAAMFPEIRASLQVQIPKAFDPAFIPVEELEEPVPPLVQIDSNNYAELLATVSDRVAPKKAVMEGAFLLLIDQFDSRDTGILVFYVQCVKDKDGKVRKLLSGTIAEGRGPWAIQVLKKPYEASPNSISALAILQSEAIFNNQYIGDEPFKKENILDADLIKSYAAYPLKRGELGIAGAVFIGSTNPNFFTPTIKQGCKLYVDIAATGIRDIEFVPPHDIILGDEL